MAIRVPLYTLARAKGYRRHSQTPVLGGPPTRDAGIGKRVEPLPKGSLDTAIVGPKSEPSKGATQSMCAGQKEIRLRTNYLAAATRWTADQQEACLSDLQTRGTAGA